MSTKKYNRNKRSMRDLHNRIKGTSFNRRPAPYRRAVQRLPDDRKVKW